MSGGVLQCLAEFTDMLSTKFWDTYWYTKNVDYCSILLMADMQYWRPQLSSDIQHNMNIRI